MPDVATKASLPRAATLLEAVAEDEDDARFESTTVTVDPSAMYKAPPLKREPLVACIARFVAKLHTTRNTVDESVYIPPP